MMGFTPVSHGTRGFEFGKAPQVIKDAGWGVAQKTRKWVLVEDDAAGPMKFTLKLRGRDASGKPYKEEPTP